ncbi:hypothetical protein, partial [[Clostridium] scindens]|uniref:hypothetical protein n=1 Tax=Clostridium scindens (strain JCM 10418 / VPI 12708) TaxID=29347 RepID=UPI001A9B475F
VCNGYVAGRIAASRGLATFSNLEMQHSPKIFCIFLQKVLAKNNAIFIQLKGNKMDFKQKCVKIYKFLLYKANASV